MAIKISKELASGIVLSLIFILMVLGMISLGHRYLPDDVSRETNSVKQTQVVEGKIFYSKAKVGLKLLPEEVIFRDGTTIHCLVNVSNQSKGNENNNQDDMISCH